MYTLDPQEVIDSEAIKKYRKMENDELLDIGARRFARQACDLMAQKHNDKYRRAPSLPRRFGLRCRLAPEVAYPAFTT